MRNFRRDITPSNRSPTIPKCRQAQRVIQYEFIAAFFVGRQALAVSVGVAVVGVSVSRSAKAQPVQQSLSVAAAGGVAAGAAVRASGCEFGRHRLAGQPRVHLERALL